jgi:hypothetical protein
MSRIAISALTAALLCSCAGTLERQVLCRTVYAERTDTLWLVEKDTQRSAPDEIAVIVCHRDATPACIRVKPLDARDSSDYAHWLESLRAQSTAAAAPPPQAPAAEAPAAAQPAAPQSPDDAIPVPAEPKRLSLPETSLLAPFPDRSAPHAADNPY